MALTIPNGCGTLLSLEEVISIWMHNIRLQVKMLVHAENKLSVEEHDARYNDFGTERESYNPYPLSLAEAEAELRAATAEFRCFAEDMAEVGFFPSSAVAAHLAERLGQQNPTRTYDVKTEIRGDLVYLTVADQTGIVAVVDVDTEMGEGNRRNVLENEKVIDGVSYPLYSFIPEEYRNTHQLYRKKICETAQSGDE